MSKKRDDKTSLQSDSGDWISVVIVNELNVLYIFLLSLIGKRIWVLGVIPFVPTFNRPIEWILKKLLRMPNVEYAIEYCQELERTRTIPDKVMQFDVFAEIEDWVTSYFDFPSVNNGFEAYGIAFKKAACNYVKDFLEPLLILHCLNKRPEVKRIRLIGLRDDFKSANMFYEHRKIILPKILAKVLYLIVNTFIALSGLTFSIGWVLSRIRLFGYEKKRYFFAVDYIHDGRDEELLEVLNDAGDQLIVLRHRAFLKLYAGNLPEKLDVCIASDGRFELIGGISAVTVVVVDNFKLWWKFKHCTAPVFLQVALFPYRRMMGRAFFNRFKVRYFWGRDPYNVEHIFRRAEIHRIGGKSLGMNVSFLTTWTILWPQFRYLNYDMFYVFERAILEEHYGDTWPESMELIPVGTGLATRDFFRRRMSKRTKDIVVFCGVFVGEIEFVEFIRGLAISFSDRKILVQVKDNKMNEKIGNEFIEKCTQSLSNVEYTKDSVYDLIFRVRYAISDPSSLVAEALQLGCFGFGFDIPGKQKANILRSFPNLTFSKASQAEAQIRGIEAGTNRYNVELYSKLVDLSGVAVGDRVRINMGLCPKEAAVPLTADYFNNLGQSQ